MIVRGESTIIDYHAPFDQGFMRMLSTENSSCYSSSSSDLKVPNKKTVKLSLFYWYVLKDKIKDTPFRSYCFHGNWACQDLYNDDYNWGFINV